MKSSFHLYIFMFMLFFTIGVSSHEIELDAIVVDDDAILDSGVKPYEILSSQDFELIQNTS